MRRIQRRKEPMLKSVIEYFNGLAGSEGCLVTEVAEYADDAHIASIQTLISLLTRGGYVRGVRMKGPSGRATSRKRFYLERPIPEDLSLQKLKQVIKTNPLQVRPKKALSVCGPKIEEVDGKVIVELFVKSNGPFDLDFARDILDGCPECVKGVKIISIEGATPKQDFFYKLCIPGGVTR